MTVSSNTMRFPIDAALWLKSFTDIVSGPGDMLWSCTACS